MRTNGSAPLTGSPVVALLALVDGPPEHVQSLYSEGDKALFIKYGTAIAQSMQVALLQALEPAKAAVADGSLVFPGSEVYVPAGVYDLRATLHLLATGAGVGRNKAEGGKAFEAFRVNHWRASRALIKQGKLRSTRLKHGTKPNEIRWVRLEAEG